ncbi:hypothetical protein P43SY_001197 [Pythium insidiosum]|uniref:Sodium/calcium exchanger membrane region domain-containing protein n=1 Tax=Pythium insidiosum TaxID=114742 RepID=A0AAD5MET8_PYTIN|nr:hypothetical protein P43SY_001197 [Pythium insidiosum]
MGRGLPHFVGITVAFVGLCCLLQPVSRISGLPRDARPLQLHGPLNAHANLPSDVATPIDCSNPATSPTADSFVDYQRLVHCSALSHSVVGARLRLVHCSALSHSVVGARLVLALVLVFLLYLLSSTADSFFCPALQAIVETYRIPPDVAGVTFLSFGNGSPDVFSNIAAFSTSTPKIGIASILGGGLLVTTVIVASVGLASQDQVQLIPRKFIRDVASYTVAIAYLCLVFFDGKVGLAEALGFLGLYCCYVSMIVFDSRLVRIFGWKDEHSFDELVVDYDLEALLPNYMSTRPV